MPITWNAAYNGTPAGSDDPAEGDDRIRELKVAIQTGMEHESDWLNTAQADRGWHKSGSAKIYFTAAAPTLRPDGVTALTSADAGRIWMSSATAIPKVRTSGGSWVSCAVSPVADQTIGGIKTFTSGYAVAGQSAIAYKILTTGSWNMSAGLAMSLPSGLTNATILDIRCLVKTDNDVAQLFIRGTDLSGEEVKYYPSTGKVLIEANATEFTNIAYNSTGFDRGQVFITYKA